VSIKEVFFIKHCAKEIALRLAREKALKTAFFDLFFLANLNLIKGRNKISISLGFIKTIITFVVYYYTNTLI